MRSPHAESASTFPDLFDGLEDKTLKNREMNAEYAEKYNRTKLIFLLESGID